MLLRIFFRIASDREYSSQNFICLSVEEVWTSVIKLGENQMPRYFRAQGFGIKGVILNPGLFRCEVGCMGKLSSFCLGSYRISVLYVVMR